ncbi:ABC transporter ATP-binding protein [Anaerotignum sp. MB30-C6]|uniref:ABC transporter ATP-binding protein n=1 Tax=Anaerotignum sp. MB30-C6 TaxID=3070814 RepID=UPI0027DD8931|nr:ABC transporter ATP-binding protein [Anaerotignum sp. MB30-C6]WMI79899.1 ABC transporter ATP-binding protein [Anaerotignum sp. MB30-C6]
MITLKNVSFSYEGEERKSLNNINLSIKKGEFIVLCGKSGCGKTSITRLLNGLIPHYYDGKLEGETLLDNNSISQLPLYDIAREVGSVFQNPKSQFFNQDVFSELAFICENLGMTKREIHQRVTKSISSFSISHLLERDVSQLSGGEKQRIACASVSAPNPNIYLFDEPSSNLDVQGIALLRNTMANLKKQGKTIVVAEHRLHYLMDLADKIILMVDGKIEKSYTREDFLNLPPITRNSMGLRCARLQELLPYKSEEKPVFQKHIAFKGFCYMHKSAKKHSLHMNPFYIPKGSVTAIIGENGAGKSTFAKCLCGIYKKCGLMEIEGKDENWKARRSTCYMVMQDVNHQLFTESVLDEVLLSMDQEEEVLAKKVLKSLDLEHLSHRHPISLSGGQKQRAAIATAVVSNREVIIFDEPTSGLDFTHMKEVSKQLRELSKTGKTIMVITHDPELILDCCNYIIKIGGGGVKESYPLHQNREKLLHYFIEGGVSVE